MYIYSFFFFNDTATTEIYTLSLHDALPIYVDDVDADVAGVGQRVDRRLEEEVAGVLAGPDVDRKSTRLNSSHSQISYAVFCLKKKKKKKKKKTNKKKKKKKDIITENI